MTKLNDGTSREVVLNGFLYSTEFANLTEAYGIKAVRDGATPPSSTGGGVEDFVKRFYSVVLGREADAGGLADWVNRLNTKVATGADIATGFVFSDEFDEASKDDVTFLNVLYSAFFNRDADEGGLNGWLDKLEQGTSRVDVLNGFLHSDEFVALAESYGITAYTIPVTSASSLTELFVGKTYYDYDYGTVATILFGEDGIIYSIKEDGSAEIVYYYSIVGNTMRITQDNDDEVFTLSNFEVVSKGIGYTTDNGDNRGFYFTYEDAQADAYNDQNNNTNTNTHVDNDLTVSISMSGNTLTAVFNKEMVSSAGTSGPYNHDSTAPYWSDAYTFVMVFDSFTAGGVITLFANGFKTTDNGTLAADATFTFPS